MLIGLAVVLEGVDAGQLEAFLRLAGGEALALIMGAKCGLVGGIGVRGTTVGSGTEAIDIAKAVAAHHAQQGPQRGDRRTEDGQTQLGIGPDQQLVVQPVGLVTILNQQQLDEDD